MANYIHQVQTAEGTIFDLEAGKVLNNVNIKTINNTTMVGNGNIALPTFGAIASATVGLASNAAVVSATAAMATTGYVDEKIAAATSSIIVDTPLVTEQHGAIIRKDSINTIAISTTSKGPIVFGESNTVGDKRADYALIIGKNNIVANGNIWTDYAIVAGHSNTVIQGENLTIGQGNENKNRYGLVAGRSLLTTAKVAQAVIGQWNEQDSAAQFIVGVGADSSNRANSLAAYASGVYASKILAPTASSTDLSPGTTGQLLSSTGNGVQWINNESDIFIFNIETIINGEGEEEYVITNSVIDIMSAVTNHKVCFCKFENSLDEFDLIGSVFPLTYSCENNEGTFLDLYILTGAFSLTKYESKKNYDISISISCSSNIPTITVTITENRYTIQGSYLGSWAFNTPENKSLIDVWYKNGMVDQLYLNLSSFTSSSGENYLPSSHVIASVTDSFNWVDEKIVYLSVSDATIWEVIFDEYDYICIPRKANLNLEILFSQDEQLQYHAENISFLLGFVNTSNLSGKIWYATCNTAASTAAKVATILKGNDEIFSLEAGTIVFVNFTYTNSASGPTLNINDTGPLDIAYHRASSAGDSGALSLISSGMLFAGTHVFMYDGTYWILLSANSDGYVYQQNTTTSSSYRVLFSGNANNTSQTTTTRKSGNLLFNPSTSTLTVGNGTSTGTVLSNTLTLGTFLQTPKVLAPTTSGGSTYGAGSSGQVLTSNGTTSYWGDLPSNEPVLLYTIQVIDEITGEESWYVGNVSGVIYKQSQLITLYQAGNTFTLCDNCGIFSYAPGLPLTVPMDVIEDYSSGYGDPCYTAATPFFQGRFDGRPEQGQDQGICVFVPFFSENFVGTDEDAKLYIIRTSNNAVTQTSTSSDSDFRVLLSSASSDVTLTAGVNKSGNLIFNPYTNTLHIGVGAVSSATIELANGAGSLSNEELSGTDTVILQSTAGDLSLQGDYVYINDYYGNTILLSDEGINLSSFNLMANRQPLISTITLYFGQGGLYKDAARTTLYTTADFANDIMDKDPQLYIDGGGDSSRYPATYYYEKSGAALNTARITCLVNEANTLYTAVGVYSTGTEGFVISSSTINKIPTGGTAGQVLTKIGSSDYAVSWVTPSGGGSAPITGITNPTTSTQGELGQMYLNTTTELMYVCTYATSGTYHWKPITFESAESQVG